MIELLVFKEKLKSFYGKYDMYITPVVKFALGFLTFYLLNQNIGFMARLKNPIIPVILALVCSFVPYGVMTFLAAVVMLLHISSVSFEIALVILVFLLIMGILYYGFQPGDSYLLLLTPILFYLKIPYVVPILVGLSCGLLSIIPVSCGVFLFYVLQYVKQNAGVLTNDASVEITQKYAQLIRVLLSNQLMVVMMAAFAISILVVYLIKNLSIDYAWMIAIITGTVAQLAAIFVGDFVFSVTVPLGPLLLGALASIVIAGIYHFFIFAVDYSRTEYLQFEDDEYHYYVKAVPKIVVTAPDVKVQKINARRAQRNVKE